MGTVTTHWRYGARGNTWSTRCAASHNATLGRRDFYRQLCLALGLAPAATAGNFFYAVSSHVEELARERVHPVFFLDEAHLLHQDTLDHLHILLNVRREALTRPGTARGPPLPGRAG